jgi:BirA family biotin operon repressor/biotin-[acetyl-CoA-carboxylase] ligase
MRRISEAIDEMSDGKKFGSRFFHLSSVDSTNAFARTLVSKKEEDPDGTVVIAYEQTGGKGRRDRKWTSPPGGIYLSLIIELGSPEKAGLLNVLSALPVAKAIGNLDQDCRIKWPNDLIIGDKKVGGILGELVSGERKYAIIGIGINSNIPVSKLPDDLRDKSTSLMDEVGREVPNPNLVDHIIQEYHGFIRTFIKGEVDELLLEYRKSSIVLGKRVVIKSLDETFDGIAEDIGEDGSLILKVGNEVRRVVEGDVLECRTVG